MGPSSSESSLISYPLREGGMMLKTAVQAVESKPRILFGREWNVLAQAPSSSEIGLGNKTFRIIAHLSLPFHFLVCQGWDPAPLPAGSFLLGSCMTSGILSADVPFSETHGHSSHQVGH